MAPEATTPAYSQGEYEVYALCARRPSASAPGSKQARHCAYRFRVEVNNLKAIGYIRVSRVGGRGGDSFISPEVQRRSIEGLADRAGLTIVDWYEELDRSGGDPTRPMWNMAIERIERGEVQGFCVWNLARFARSTSDALSAMERIENAGGAVYSASGEAGDDSPTGRMTRTFFLAIAQMERERATENFVISQALAVERGIWSASKVPIGYRRDEHTRKLVPDPEMRQVVVAVFEMRVAGESWTKLARYLIEHGGSQKTDRAAVKWIVSNPTYLGWTRSGMAVNRNAHEPLVSQLLFDKANAVKGRRPSHDGSQLTDRNRV